MSNITNHKKEECCGCTACVMICPTKALQMEPDEEGYLYPSLNRERCIDCGKCERVCPMLHKEEGRCIDVIAAKAKDDNDRLQSTSGGVFPILARSILSQGGLVAGVVFDDQFSVIHILSDKNEDIDRMRGSKYVQSRLDNLFDVILQEIATRKVLFTGTPCQCEGLRRFVNLKKGNIENLILCDLVCDGVPSPKLWKDYVQYLESIFGDKLTNFIFRNKKEGWSYNTQSAVFGEVDKSSSVNSKFSWIELFTNHSLRRPSCYYCPYTNHRRNSDLTIGDFWGIEKFVPDFEDNLGISAVLIHSPKGEKIWSDIKSKALYVVGSISDCQQKRLLFPIIEPDNRKNFWSQYNSKGIKCVLDKYGKRNFVKRFIYKNVLPITKKIKLYDTLFNLYHHILKR